MRATEFITEEFILKGKIGNGMLFGVSSHLPQQAARPDRNIPWAHVEKILKRLGNIKPQLKQMIHFPKFWVRDADTGVEVGGKFTDFGKPTVQLFYINTVIQRDTPRGPGAESPTIYSTPNKTKNGGINEDDAMALPSVPAEPGTEPIKPGFVRLYHQTDGDNLRAIEKEGLLLQHARGIEGPRAIYAGETPFYGKAESRPTLEFQVPKNMWDAPFVLMDVTPEYFIAAHYPWHQKARYIENEEKTLSRTLAGDFDDLDGDYAKAVQYVKAKYNK